ncbi:hypothetical protein [Streptomyces sp. NPDC049916]|uniref:hypothetical protein n=1 Tax=Streptomyces sp. NPDC049916 TaxID=3155156 RepID=UPI003419E2A4
MVNDDANRDNCQKGHTDKPAQYRPFLGMGSVSSVFERLLPVGDAFVNFRCGRILCELFSRDMYESSKIPI